MKIRTLIISILGVLVVSSFSPAQDTDTLKPEPLESAFSEPDSAEAQPGSSFAGLATEAPPRPTRLRRLGTPPTTPPPGVAPTPTPVTPRPAATPTEVRIIELKYARAVDMYAMIYDVFGIQVHFDQPSNRLVVNATKEQIKSIMSVIAEMDVPGLKASTLRDIQNLVYRIYMFEIPSGDRGMRSFSMILQTSARVSSKELSVAAADNDFQISEFLQINNGLSEPQAEILIQGKAASDEAFKRFFEKFPESHIMELKWDDDETFTDNIAAAQYTQLPEQMQKHIRKFLGDEIRTVGYWFGNSSVPGKVEAPIGPWTLSLRLDTESDRMLELNVDVEVPREMHHFDSRLGRERNDEILSNTIRAKIGKPIIIGYNRESYGTRKMGAMVIVSEADPVQSDAADTNAF